MWFIYVLEVAVGLLVFAFVVTQLLIPFVQKRPLFPLFRTRQVALVNEVIELTEQVEEEKLVQEVIGLRQVIEDMRNRQAASIEKEILEQGSTSNVKEVK